MDNPIFLPEGRTLVGICRRLAETPKFTKCVSAHESRKFRNTAASQRRCVNIGKNGSLSVVIESSARQLWHQHVTPRLGATTEVVIAHWLP